MHKHPKTTKRAKKASASELWAENEFATLAVSDTRRVRRLKRMAADLHAQPGASIPKASGNWATTKGFYRLVESGTVDAGEVFRSHRDALVERVKQRGQEVVLVAQDTTSLNFGARPNTEGLGRNGDKTHSGDGLLVHSSLCVGAREGEVFGLLGAQMWAREAAPAKVAAVGARNRKRIAEKESRRWVEGWQQAHALHERLGGKQRVVSVADREGDIYEVFASCLQAQGCAGGGADLLVRSRHDRRLRDAEQGGGSWQYVEGLEAMACLEVMVPRAPGKAQRRARLEVRYAQVELKAPADKVKYLGLDQPLQLWLVIVQEIAPPSGCTPICWRLWTTVAIGDAAGAVELVGWYARRWLIEEFHRILKSGCKVERRQLESAGKLSLVLALDMVVACYLLGLTKAARQHPAQSACAWLEEDEWKALYCYTHQNKIPLQQAPSLRSVVHWIARLGGFLNRKGDGEPGAQVLWQGMQRLRDITEAYRLFADHEICG